MVSQSTTWHFNQKVEKFRDNNFATNGVPLIGKSNELYGLSWTINLPFSSTWEFNEMIRAEIKMPNRYLILLVLTRSSNYIDKGNLIRLNWPTADISSSSCQNNSRFVLVRLHTKRNKKVKRAVPVSPIKRWAVRSSIRTRISGLQARLLIHHAPLRPLEC